MPSILLLGWPLACRGRNILGSMPAVPASNLTTARKWSADVPFYATLSKVLTPILSQVNGRCYHRGRGQECRKTCEALHDEISSKGTNSKKLFKLEIHTSTARSIKSKER
jgi:hypothetical protein